MTTPCSPKHIQYRRTDGDYDAYYDGEYIGSFATHHQAEVELDAHALDLLERGLVDTVADITTMQWQATDALPEGYRVAAEDEAGWTYPMGNGRTLWITDEPALVLARPGETAEPVYVPTVVTQLGREVRESDQVWHDSGAGVYIITLSAAKVPALYPNAQWLGRLNRGVFAAVWLALEPPIVHARPAEVVEPIEVCLSYDECATGFCTTCDDLPPARPVAPQASATLSALASTPHIASVASDEPLTSDRPAVALLCIEGLITYYQRADGTVFYTVPGDLAEHAAISWPARETHCQHLTACASSICPACVPPERAPFRCPLCATNEHRATACPEIKRERERQIEQAKWGETMFWLYRNQRDILQHSLRTAPQIYSERAEALALYLGDTTGVFVPVPMVERHLVRLADAL